MAASEFIQLARYNGKRSRRVWNKKIRYNCRKSLADRRLRVKGRFVKRSEQEQLAKELEAEAADLTAATTEGSVPVVDEADAPASSSNKEVDEDMPDVNDPEAGFSPTEDMPYRRLRRHTIT
jgi:lactam utilization protein B